MWTPCHAPAAGRVGDAGFRGQLATGHEGPHACDRDRCGAEPPPGAQVRNVARRCDRPPGHAGLHQCGGVTEYWEWGA
jgi:hypothetical protein